MDGLSNSDYGSASSRPGLGGTQDPQEEQEDFIDEQRMNIGR